MKGTLCLSATAVATLILIGVWPQLDLATSRLFFDGTGFLMADNGASVALRWVLRVLPFIPALAGLVIIAASRWLPRTVLGLGRRGWAAITLTFVLGPGLLVNALLKTYWGRARPRNVTEFGGDKLFTAPHQWSDQCAANCSFVSGEVSAVTALTLALLTLIAANRDRLGQGTFTAGVVISCLLPVLSAFQRIGAGAHFLSDSILAVILTVLVAHWVQGIVDPKPR